MSNHISLTCISLYLVEMILILLSQILEAKERAAKKGSFCAQINKEQQKPLKAKDFLHKDELGDCDEELGLTLKL